MRDSTRSTSPVFLIAFLLPVVFGEFVFAVIVLKSGRFVYNDLLFWVSAINKILIEICIYYCISAAIHWFVRSMVPLLVFQILFFLLQAIDSLFYHYSAQAFSFYFIRFTTAYSIKPFLNFYTASILFIAFLSCSCSVYIGIRYKERLYPKIFLLAILSLFLAANMAALPRFVFQRKQNVIRQIEDSDHQHLELYLEERVWDQLNHAFTPHIKNILVKNINQAKNNYKTITNLDLYRRVITKYGLSLGDTNYHSLGLRQFNKIILFATESLSLDFISAHNKFLKEEFTPFYSSPEVVGKTFTNYWTSGYPTISGITISLNSHPNPDLVLKGNTHNSLVNLLNQEGYETIFLRSCSKYFADENIYFKQFGFNQVIGREDFVSDDRITKYIQGWGLMDRFLYEKIFTLLENHERVFICVLGVDTHPPEGRSKDGYNDLFYPAYTSSYYKDEVGRFLKSIHHHDYDMMQFIKKIKKSTFWKDDLLLMLTADHGCGYPRIVNSISKKEFTHTERLPMILLTPQGLPPIRRGRLGSQLDLAPTLAHLLDLPPYPGWWGKSLFSSKNGNYLGYRNNLIYSEFQGTKNTTKITAPGSEVESQLIKLFNSFYVIKR